jgi:hypothetical protein
MTAADAVVVVVLAVYAVGIVVFGVCSAMFRNRIVSEIQLDPRYRHDPSWKRAADSAMFFMSEVRFAKQAGIIKEAPKWLWIGRVASCLSFLFFALLVFLAKLFR